jgi:hypothetical protein
MKKLNLINSPENIRILNVQSILPNGLTIWGTSIVTVIIILILLISLLISYPDKITGKVIITTTTPPTILVTQKNGLIDDFLISDNEFVHKNEIIGSLKNDLNIEKYIILKKEIFTIDRLFQTNQIWKYNINNANNYNFGEAQDLFNNLIFSIKESEKITENKIESINNNFFKVQIRHQKVLLKYTIDEINLAKLRLMNNEIKYKSDKALFEENIISQSNFFERSKEYFDQKNALIKLQKSLIILNQEINLFEKNQLLGEADFTQKKIQLNNSIKNNIDELKIFMDNWTRNNHFVSPTDGKLVYLKEVSKNKFFRQGDNLCAIIPGNKKIIAKIKLTSAGLGKIHIGQKVIIKLDSYPYYEFGTILGSVEQISILPNDSKYTVSVNLINGMKTQYGKLIRFIPEMTGEAEIITKDINLFQRFFSKFNSLRK